MNSISKIAAIIVIAIVAISFGACQQATIKQLQTENIALKEERDAAIKFIQMIEDNDETFDDTWGESSLYDDYLELNHKYYD